MAAESKRLTIVVTREMEGLLADAKKKYFYDKNQSDMIRALITAGLDTVEKRAFEKGSGDADLRSHEPRL